MTFLKFYEVCEKSLPLPTPFVPAYMLHCCMCMSIKQQVLAAWYFQYVKVDKKSIITNLRGKRIKKSVKNLDKRKKGDKFAPRKGKRHVLSGILDA